MEDAIRVFQSYIVGKGLKCTPQRFTIVEVFIKSLGHPSTEEIYDRVRTIDSTIGQTTVYRTMKLLCDSGLAREVQFGDGLHRYERRLGTEHHDHLICESCGSTVEVVDPQIEELQEELARKHDFYPTTHHLYMYGICANCRQNEKKI